MIALYDINQWRCREQHTGYTPYLPRSKIHSMIDISVGDIVSSDQSLIWEDRLRSDLHLWSVQRAPPLTSIYQLLMIYVPRQQACHP